MIKKKNEPGYEIQKNTREVEEVRPMSTTNFERKVARKDRDYLNSLSDKRFDAI